jgi:anaphase-promoting complex subunit 10
MVSIRAIRIFLDYEADESYTPTKISLLAGTGYHDLIPFASLEFTHPKGWIPVSLDNVGGGEDGKTLRAFLVQVKIVENHQNGKDTHVRGLKIYARDERAGRTGMDILGDEVKTARKVTATKITDTTGFLQPDWMREPEIR